MVDSSRMYLAETTSLNYDVKLPIKKQINQAKQKIKDLSEHLVKLSEYRDNLQQKHRILNQKNIRTDDNKNKVAVCCSRAFRRIMQLISKSYAAEKTPLEKMDEVIEDTLLTRDRLLQDIINLKKTQDICKEILDALNGKKTETSLRRILDSRLKDFFGDALQHVFKYPLKSDQRTKLRNFLCSNFISYQRYLKYNRELRYFLPIGCNAVIEHLRNKTDTPLELQHRVFREPNHFVSYVTNKQLNENDPPEVFLVRCKESITQKLSVHITTVLLKQVDENNLVLIWPDSVSNYTHLEKELSDIETDLKMKGIKLNIFFLPTSRQTTPTDCAVFAIQDAISLSIHHEEMLQQSIEAIRKEPDSSLYLSRFPHRFYWISQKSEVAIDVMKNIPEDELKEFVEKYKKNLVNTPEGKHNLRAEKIGDKYEGIIWKQIILDQEMSARKTSSYWRFK